MDEVQNSMDEVYNALNGLQDYIRQKDKGSFQREAQMRKLSFELEQLRSMISKIPHTRALNPDNILCSESSVSISEKEKQNIQEQKIKTEQNQEEMPMEDHNEEERSRPLANVDTGSGKIHLGDVSILINPEDESDNI